MPDDPHRPEPLDSARPDVDPVWYAAYGSNMHLARLTCYLAGGRPPGATRSYPGCRDPRGPERAVPVLLPGQLYFALESRTWGGGAGFYDQLDPGEMPARGYLLTAQQFSDIVAQEMYQEPGEDLDLSRVLADGRDRLGPGRYQTLVCPGLLDGRPVLTFTAPGRSAQARLNPPSAAYLVNLAVGLREAHGWERARIAEYLSSRPGASGAWTAAAVAEVCAAG